MSEPEPRDDARPLVSKTPSEEFANYCEIEFECRRNSEQAFDEQRYRKAMALVLDKLRCLEDEGRA